MKREESNLIREHLFTNGSIMYKILHISHVMKAFVLKPIVNKSFSKKKKKFKKVKKMFKYYVD